MLCDKVSHWIITIRQYQIYFYGAVTRSLARACTHMHSYALLRYKGFVVCPQ